MTITATLIAPPAPAHAWGISELTFFDDFDSIGTIDVNNSKADGFNWYVVNWPDWYSDTGHTTGYVPSPAADFSVSNSILTINTNQDSPRNAWQLMTRTWLGGSSWAGSVPLISGTAPFYLEMRCRVNSTPGIDFNPNFWIEDLLGLQDKANNNTASRSYGEIDIMEMLATGHCQQTALAWTNNSTRTLDSVDVGAVDSSFHKWGMLYVPMASGNGTGRCRWFKDRIPQRGDVTWTSGSTYSSMENSNFPMIFSGVGGQNFDVDYVALWT